MKTFDSLSHAESTKFNNLHSIHFDLNVLDLVSKSLMSNPDPDFICCFASKLSSFIKNDVLPLLQRHEDDTNIGIELDAQLACDKIFESVVNDEISNYENECNESSSNNLEDN